MLKDENLIKRFKRTVNGILFEAFPFSTGFFHSVLFNPPPVKVSVNKRLAAHLTFLDTDLDLDPSSILRLQTAGLISKD